LSRKPELRHEFGFIILAFVVPFFVRMIPEIIAWPYPLGFDTLGYYIPAMRWWINPFTGQNLPTDIFGLLRTAGLFYVLAVAFNRYLVPDPFIAIKLLGPILTGFVSLSVYSHGRLALRWPPRKVLFASLIATLYFVGLRISWELYRNMLGVVFLFAALIALESFEDIRGYLLVLLFTLLTFMSHQITGVILLGILLLRTAWFYRRGKPEDAKAHLCFSLVAGALLSCQLYSPRVGTLVIPVASAGLQFSPESWRYVLGFPVYCFIFLLPLVLFGARLRRGRSIDFWTLSCLILLLPVLAEGTASIPLWFRWPLMLIYPLSFYFTEGFERALRFGHWHSPSGFVVKATAIGLVAMIILTSGYYLVAYPEQASPYTSQFNPYLRYVQSSMLQNSISIQDTPSLLSAIDAASSLLDNDSVLVVHEAVYVWAVNRLGMSANVVAVKEPGYVSVNPESAGTLIERISQMKYESGYRVYTIWWTSGSGWYTMPELPASFTLLQNKGAFGIYLFTPG
jgi:hypothetical protein